MAAPDPRLAQTLAQVGRRAPDAVLQGDGDLEVRLSELWRDGPAVLLFLRHFG